MKKVLFAISSLGLGHATRTLPIIHHYRQFYQITIVSYGNTLRFLKSELKDAGITFIEFEDYPKLERGVGVRFYLYLIHDIIKTTFIIRKEHNFLQTIEKEYAFVFSDGRYGFYSDTIPSFILSHQISFVPPKGLAALTPLSNYSNMQYFRRFTRLLIPDFAENNHSMSGKLSHVDFLKKIPHSFVGVLSSYKPIDIKKDIDFLFVISGYLEDFKDTFIASLIKQAKEIEGKKVFILGNTSGEKITHDKEHNITIYPSASGELRKQLMNRANVVVSRTGYTTIMDLSELQKKAILFATPNSTEQEYLAEYFAHNQYYVIGDSQKTQIKHLLDKLKNTRPFPVQHSTTQSIKLIDDIISKHLA